MLLVDDLAAGGTKNLRHTPRGLVTLLVLSADYFANILDPDQARQNFRPDLDTNCFDTNGIPKRNLKKVILNVIS